MIIHSILLIGQSNMAGRGKYEEAHEINTENLFVLRSGRWQPLYRPVVGDRPFSGVCLAESFAEKYAKEHSGVGVGLIPCADGGTRLDQWKIGSLLYDNAVNCARLAQRTSSITAILWHQGESDCDDMRAPVYYEKLSEIMAGFRRDLSLPDVPILVGGLGEYLEKFSENTKKHYKSINASLERYAKDNPHTGFVSAEGLAPNPDNLHFSSESLYRFGLRYYEEFSKLEDKEKIYEEKPECDLAVREAIESL